MLIFDNYFRNTQLFNTSGVAFAGTTQTEIVNYAVAAALLGELDICIDMKMRWNYTGLIQQSEWDICIMKK